MLIGEPVVWRVAPPKLSAPAGCVDIWQVGIGEPESMALPVLLGLLSDDERARAERFRFSRARTEFIVARAGLRSILSRYLDAGPARMRFRYAAQGKPCLDFVEEQVPLHFNVSHSHGLAVYAVTTGCEVGIDVEKVRASVATERIARRYFSAREVADFLRVRPEQRCRAFFNCWTRKEAYLKARGSGLSAPLDQFDVTLTPGEPAKLLEDRSHPGEAPWHLTHLDLGADYIGAVATAVRPDAARCWRLGNW